MPDPYWLLYWTAYVLGAYLLADLTTGVVHWAEDRYADPDGTVLGPLVAKPNLEHHRYPARFTKVGYWERNWTTLVPAAAIVAVGWLASWPFLVLAGLFGSQANEIHAWAHQRCSWGVRMVQKTGLLQSPWHHGQHHRPPYLSHYCVMSNWLNPLLNRLEVWRAAELVIRLLTGVRPVASREEF